VPSRFAQCDAELIKSSERPQSGHIGRAPAADIPDYVTGVRFGHNFIPFLPRPHAEPCGACRILSSVTARRASAKALPLILSLDHPYAFSHWVDKLPHRQNCFSILTKMPRLLDLDLAHREGQYTCRVRSPYAGSGTSERLPPVLRTHEDTADAHFWQRVSA
jgi:hypothetical protein